MKKQSRNKAITIFEGKKIRRHWDEEKELWYFAISDIIAVLTNGIGFEYVGRNRYDRNF